jgi:hypothetical protein
MCEKKEEREGILVHIKDEIGRGMSTTDGVHDDEWLTR